MTSHGYYEVMSLIVRKVSANYWNIRAGAEQQILFGAIFCFGTCFKHARAAHPLVDIVLVDIERAV